MEQDTVFMDMALRLAERAAKREETPIGCVIVFDGPGRLQGRVIGKGLNRRNARGSVLEHAEIMAIRQASRRLRDWRLEDCTLYVTLEPCPMCAGAIVQARIPRVVIGAMNPKAGCAGSVTDLLREPRFNHQCEVTAGVRGEESRALLQRFFRSLREKGSGRRQM